ncbi:MULTISPECIES: adenylate/guanylate cyclase domain-containing protein [unclassified Bradyrhizobium]|uniref:adenylate/guanylate cyclase domain-containing protein n=1 Tax=unclassified Bradyrhizobium TaxID=2631580 RepID=UPI0024796C5D|nr:MULTISPECIES: adenylate/guanylate cyclase domain-containing protein [unclassified Bradyrhizobium]WGS18721.1 tetratricopeptide repeat protein [Bradyrhizobium sp. ISRA463]WGS25546.1 tetratricopeptide repeat protein [Bradyrhizobium sp. ISRA464]
MAADVVGYSALMERDEEATYAEFERLKQELIGPSLSRHEGRLIKTTGDGALAEFASPLAAVRCAVEIQDRPASDRSRLKLRVGLNLGDVIVGQEGDLYGDGINIAVRLEGIADPGGILISEKVFSEVEGKLDVGFEDRGEQQLKNISKPVRAYAVRSGAHSTLAERLSEAPTLPDKPSIAVLPFENMSGDPEQEYFADGIVEDIITALSRVPSIFVIARNSSFSYKGMSPDIRQVGRELGVRYVLEGSVRKSGARVRITGQLVEAATGAHIWAEKIDGGVEDVFDLQDKVTASVVAAIEPRLLTREMERARQKPTGNLKAYDFFLRALANLHRATREPIEEALRLVERAIALDPDYAMAIALKARLVYRLKVIGVIAPSDPRLEEAAMFAWAAAEKRHDDPDVLWLAGFVIALAGGDFAGGTALIERSLALHPNSADALAAHGLIQAYLGKAESATASLDKAMRLNPVLSAAYLALVGYATLSFVQGDYETALAWVTKSLHENPRWRIALQLRAACLGLLGRIDEAREAMRNFLAANPNETLATMRAYLQTSFQDAASLDAYLEGLRRAGLPAA